MVSSLSWLSRCKVFKSFLALSSSLAISDVLVDLVADLDEATALLRTLGSVLLWMLVLEEEEVTRRDEFITEEEEADVVPETTLLADVCLTVDAVPLAEGARLLSTAEGVDLLVPLALGAVAFLLDNGSSLVVVGVDQVIVTKVENLHDVTEGNNNGLVAKLVHLTDTVHQQTFRIAVLGNVVVVNLTISCHGPALPEIWRCAWFSEGIS
ncbi:hypothetical protein WICPIJ_000517 [Wickerhamomyces pijperi]|uniref:Uncharacterized protein n=1 Tax=Wickerhamomyces pijperi TaxID=599730 RepID=A0A9P8QG20_WICPI|nr:hypothetical protein WICPIJ_000517 [Wickerhamomyces pijperi]